MNALIESKHVLTNALLFQILWFSAILGQGYWSLIPLSFMFVHLFSMGKYLTISLIPLVVLAVIGVVFDSIFNYAGVYQFSSESLSLPFLGIPVWLATLWLGFCLTLPVSLAWLIKKPYLFVIGCALLGPMSYLAGRRLEALNFADANIWLLAIEWCVFSIIALIILFPKLGVSKTPLIFLKKESAC